MRKLSDCKLHAVLLHELHWSLRYYINQNEAGKTKQQQQKNLETNDNENTMTQNLWDAAKPVLRGKFIAIQSYLKKQKTSQINNLTLHLKQLEKEVQKPPKLVEGKKS